MPEVMVSDVFLCTFHFVPEQLPGKSLVVADTLSRIPVSDAPDDILSLEIDVELVILE